MNPEYPDAEPPVLRGGSEVIADNGKLLPEDIKWSSSKDNNPFKDRFLERY